jgi:hypothetical protein
MRAALPAVLWNNLNEEWCVLFDKVMPLYVWPRIIIIGSKWM